MPCGQIHLYDDGVPFTINLQSGGSGINIEGAFLQLEFLKPNTDSFVVTPSSVHTGSDGIIQYTFTSGDLDTVGIWQYQVTAQKHGVTRHSNIKTLKVYENL